MVTAGRGRGGWGLNLSRSAGSNQRRRAATSELGSTGLGLLTTLQSSAGLRGEGIENGGRSRLLDVKATQHPPYRSVVIATPGP